MNRFRTLAPALAVFAYLTTALVVAAETSPEDASPRLLRGDLFDGGPSDAPVSAWQPGVGMVTLYPANADGLSIVNDAAGQDQSVLAGPRPIASRYPRLYPDGENLYALWWRKNKPEGHKGLYFSRSVDGGRSFAEPRQMNSADGVLARYGFAADGKGNLAAVYLDERVKDYSIYFNRSEDGGKTWLGEDLRLDSRTYPDGFKAATVNDPNVVYLNGRLIATWNDRGSYPEKKYRIRAVSRVSTDLGKTWSEAKALFEDSEFLLAEPVVLVDGDYLYYLGVMPDGAKAFRTRDGEQWEALGTLPGSGGLAASQLRVAASKGQLYAAFMGRQDQDAPYRIYFGRLDKGSGAWAEPARNLPSADAFALTRNHNPAIQAVGDSTVVVAWEDYATLRPSVVINYSMDQGKTWASDRPLPVTNAAAHRDVYPAILATGDASAAVMFCRYNSDGARTDLSYLRRDLRFDAEKGVNLPSPKPLTEEQQAARLERLNQRMKAFWEARVKGDLKAEYEYYDPYLRARVDKDQFASQRGQIKYLSFEPASIEMKGNIAETRTKFRFEVPKVFVEGKDIEMPPTDDVLPANWVWMDSDWYMRYQPGMGGAFLTY